MSGRQAFRLPTGGLVNRARPLRFLWEGRQMEGFEGDTLASALLANGVRLVGRSFKYHRPRGIMAAGTEEPNALVQLGEGARSTPNLRATEIRLFDGLVAAPVNCWPSARFDIGAVNDRFSRFLSAGFYYKTFMWPNWHLFEGVIRRAAGLGKLSREPDPDRYETRSAHCDILVVGSGPAGLAAARAAAAGGARVILAEQDDALGGTLIGHDRPIDGLRAEDWIARVRDELLAAPECRILARTTVTGYHDHNSLSLLERASNEGATLEGSGQPRFRTWTVRAAKVILATGSLERPMVFPGNDRPGVMLAGGVLQYLARHAVLAGRRMVLFANNDRAYETVFALARAGVTVAAVVDVRSVVATRLTVDLEARQIPLLRSSVVVDTRGRHALRAVRVRKPDGRMRWIEADLLAMSGGHNPNVHLFSQSGGELAFADGIAAFVPSRSVQGEVSVGAAAGVFDLCALLNQAHAAGLDAAAASGFPAAITTPAADASASGMLIEPCWRVKAPGKAFVDFQNDVTTADIELSHRENYVSVEHLKRYTTLGMAPDQGKTSNVNALAIMASLTGRQIAQTGTTRFRFPFTPVPLGAFAGRNRGELFRPLRRMPAHDRHVAAGAIFEDYGSWLRPAYYPQGGESAFEAEQREAMAVRSGAGLFEGSPLGKIEVKGRDAAVFLDLVYANTMSTLKVGKVRYGLMLSEQGVVIDDGVAARLAEDHFLISTTSAGAERVFDWMDEWLQCEWPHLDVIVAPVTTAWGVLTLTGPKARAILASLGTDIDLDPAALPHMSFALGTVGGIPARVMRVSFTGEASFEISVPASRTAALWDALLAAGSIYGLTPVGIDAWMILRTEKGYMHVGVDTDGTSTALDVGWAHVLRKKNEFIGKRSMQRSHDSRGDRQHFVGFSIAPGEPPLPVGAHAIGPDGWEGNVTSSGYSSSLGRGVALGRLRGGRARKGETVTFDTISGRRAATVCDPGGFDPTNERLNG